MMRNIETSPELIRYSVNRIKVMASLSIPNYTFPADSFIEEAIRDIIHETQVEMYRNHYIED